MYLGQINRSTDIIINGSVTAIITGLILINKRHFTKIIRERKSNNKFNKKKANCQSPIKKTLHSATNNTGNEKKNKCGL